MSDSTSPPEPVAATSPPVAPTRSLPPLIERHWSEIALSVFAVVIAGISLWIAIDTESTNRQLVSEAAWPFLQIYHSAHSAEGQQALSLNIANAGVGPAKIETLEVFWKEKPYGSAMELLKACCGLKSAGGIAQGSPEAAHVLSTSQAAGTVLRAGDTIRMVSYGLTPGNEAVYAALDAARDKITYRVCYCSVFNECWVSDGHNLNPPHVKSCLPPAVPYLE